MPETISGHLDIITASTNKVGVHLTASGKLMAGGNGEDGTLQLSNAAGKIAAVIGVTPALFPGSSSSAVLIINNDQGQRGLAFDAGSSELLIGEILRFLDGTLRLGSGGQDGKLLLRDAAGREVLTLDAANARLQVGSGGKNGFISVTNAGGSAVVSIDGGNGELKVKDSLRYIDGTLRLGDGGQNGVLLLRNSDGVETIRVDGQAGDLILANADCAEEFDLAPGEEKVAGAVMVFDEEGALRQCGQEYDRTVAGIVSGAGSFRPGIVLDRRETGRSRAPLAMVGKVFCLVDADYGPVAPGALLTTSPRRGHAMRAIDPSRAFGAVLGKALKPLAQGQALLPVMVALQ